MTYIGQCHLIQIPFVGIGDFIIGCKNPFRFSKPTFFDFYSIRFIDMGNTCLINGNGWKSDTWHEIPQGAIFAHGFCLFGEVNVIFADSAFGVEEVGGVVVGAECFIEETVEVGLGGAGAGAGEG